MLSRMHTEAGTFAAQAGNAKEGAQQDQLAAKYRDAAK